MIYSIIKMKMADSDSGQVSHLKPSISNRFSLIILILGILSLSIIFILNVLIYDPLFISGINFIRQYQHSQPQQAIKVIQNIISFICTAYGVGIVFVLYYILINRKLLLMVHLSYFLFCTYIIAILKQVFQQSRPNWYDSRIENWEWICPKDFGNPSGHSFAVIMLFQPVISDVIGYGKYRLWAVPLFIVGVMVPVSRMYLGVHSANQILFGLSYGFIFLVLYKYIFQKALYIFYWDMLIGHPLKVIKIVAVIFFHLIVIIIPIIFYSVHLHHRPMLQKDIINLNHQCQTQMTGEEVQAHILTSCSVGSFGFGLVYGFFILSNQIGYKRYILGLWRHQSKFKILIKVLIYLLSAAIPAGAFILCSSFFAQNAILKYFLNCIGVAFGGLGFSLFAPVLTAKWRIMVLLPGHAEDYIQDLRQVDGESDQNTKQIAMSSVKKIE